MSTPVTMEDVCLYWLGFITARISICITNYTLTTQSCQIFYSCYLQSTYIQYRSFFCLIMHVAHLQNISENTINVKALQVHILWHETHDSMSTTCKCGIMNDRNREHWLSIILAETFYFHISFFLLKNFNALNFADFNIPHQYLQFNWKKTWVHKETVPP